MHVLYICTSQVELPPADLGPTPTLVQNLNLLREILTSHDSSVVPLDARHADFAKVCFAMAKIILKQHCYVMILFYATLSGILERSTWKIHWYQSSSISWPQWFLLTDDSFSFKKMAPSNKCKHCTVKSH